MTIESKLATPARTTIVTGVAKHSQETKKLLLIQLWKFDKYSILETTSPTLDTASYRYPLGVGAWIRPRNGISRKPEPCSINAARTPSRMHRERAGLIFHARNRLANGESILPSDRSTSRAKQWRYAEEASPRCTVVAGLIDLYTGGQGGRTPMRKLIPIRDRVLSITAKE
jgi:hypothetical protein